MSEKQKTIFTERASEGNAELIEKLISEPESPLDDHEITEFFEFESDLYEGKYEGYSVPKFDHKGKELEFAEVLLVNSQSFKVYQEYFLTPEGKSLAFEAGLQGVVDAQNAKEVSDAFLSISFDVLENIPRKIKDKLEGESAKYVKNLYADAIFNGKEIAEPQHAQLIVDPKSLLNTVEYFMQFSNFLLSVKRELLSNPTKLNAAKAEATVIYLKKVNSELAEKYTLLLSLAKQFTAQGVELTKGFNVESIANPRFIRLADTIGEVDEERLARMLDRVRNGTQETEQGYSAIGDVHRSVFEGNGQIESAEQVVPPIFDIEEQQSLNEIIFNAAEMKQICEDYLKSLGLLSEYQFDVERDKVRTGPAIDGKWQVFIDATASEGMAVNPIRKTIRISSKFERTANQVEPAGIVGLLAHEIGGETPGHVFQAENQSRNKKSMRFSKIVKGRGAIVLKEAGGLAAERQVQREFFGNDKMNLFEYTAALDTLEKGGSELDAIKKFAEIKIANADNPSDTQVLAVLRTAADRVMRITRRHGGYNSQPLVYAEQSLIAQELTSISPELKKLIFSEASLSIPDMAKLHKYGLLNIEESFVPRITLESFIVPILKKKIAESKSQ